MARKMRKYESCWKLLKERGYVKVRLTNSEEPTVIARNVKTFRKAVQKEKYMDENFKYEFPHATIESTVEGSFISLKLKLNRPLTLDEL
jgi:hypothetical protein